MLIYTYIFSCEEALEKSSRPILANFCHLTAFISQLSVITSDTYAYILLELFVLGDQLLFK